MINQINDYGSCLLMAMKMAQKINDLAEKKNQIIDEVLNYYNIGLTSILFVGLNPAILTTKFKKVTATCISLDGQEWIQQHSHNDIEFVDFEKITGKWDVVVACDEFFTFATSDQDQQKLIQKICSLANEVVISTLKDYKNLDFKDKEFSLPSVVRGVDEFLAFTEFHNWDYKDRGHWKSYVYVNGAKSNTFGPFSRRTMYFKQLAKFSIDAGADSFLVHRNLMYKSLIKKNYEHVVSIRFEPNEY
jgi:hypothetical protein